MRRGYRPRYHRVPKLGQLLSLETEDVLPAEFAQALAVLRDAADTMPASQVRRSAAPPSAGITQTSGCPSSRPVNAIHFPSGLRHGRRISPGLAESRRAGPPAVDTDQRSSSETKTIVSL